MSGNSKRKVKFNDAVEVNNIPSNNRGRRKTFKSNTLEKSRRTEYTSKNPEPKISVSRQCEKMEALQHIVDLASTYVSYQDTARRYRLVSAKNEHVRELKNELVMLKRTLRDNVSPAKYDLNKFSQILAQCPVDIKSLDEKYLINEITLVLHHVFGIDHSIDKDTAETVRVDNEEPNNKLDSDCNELFYDVMTGLTLEQFYKKYDTSKSFCPSNSSNVLKDTDKGKEISKSEFDIIDDFVIIEPELHVAEEGTSLAASLVGVSTLSRAERGQPILDVFKSTHKVLNKENEEPNEGVLATLSKFVWNFGR
jgi:hypothetical protein